MDYVIIVVQNTKVEERYDRNMVWLYLAGMWRKGSQWKSPEHGKIQLSSDMTEEKMLGQSSATNPHFDFEIL